MEQTKIHKQIGQTEPKVPENLKRDLDFKIDKKHELPMNALEGISAEEECFHAPNLLIYLGSDYQGDVIVHAYRCSCGKTVKETFTHCHTMAFD